MGFAIPDNQPAPPPDYLPPNKILAATLASVVENDRFTFATRRRLLASIPYFQTATTVTRAFEFTAKTLYTSSGNIVIACSGKNVDIELSAVVAGVATTVSLAATFDAEVGYIGSVAPNAYETFRIKITPNNAPALAVVNGIYIFEQRLDAAELPTI
jgi:hypothetical protein